MAGGGKLIRLTGLRLRAKQAIEVRESPRPETKDAPETEALLAWESSLEPYVPFGLLLQRAILDPLDARESNIEPAWREVVSSIQQMADQHRAGQLRDAVRSLVLWP